MSPAPSVAIVVPVLGGHEHLRDLLESLPLQHRPPDEVIVVDGDPAGPVGEAVARFARSNPGLDVRLIPNPAGTIPAALNRGIRAARSEVIARMDLRGRPKSDYLRRCVAALTAQAGDVVGGHWRIRPAAGGPVAEAIALAVGHPLGAGDARYRLQAYSPAGEADTVPYGCFRKSLWQRLGGFNESLLANEDYEFNWRVRAAGGRVHFDPAIRSTYFARESLRALAGQYFRYGWWKVQMLRQHPASLRGRQLLPIAALGALVLCGVLSLFLPSARVAFGGLGLAYGILLLAAVLQLARRASSWKAPLILPLAFAVVHLSWSGGAWANLLTRGQWPFRVRARVPVASES